jgi:hypothetical protein
VFAEVAAEDFVATQADFEIRYRAALDLLEQIAGAKNRGLRELEAAAQLAADFVRDSRLR